jgi:hypothetical protein
MEMAHSASRPGSEFNDFLFAPVGEDRNGMLLSVLSALARLDVDPWQEAAKLARLPRETATLMLATLIAALPDGPSAPLDPGVVAARLIPLLPRSITPDAAPRGTVTGMGAANNPRAVLYMLFIAFLLGLQFIGTIHQPTAPADDGRPPTSNTAPAQPSPNAGPSRANGLG